MALRPGGYTEIQDADAETQRVCNEVKTAVEIKTGKKYGEFRAVKYRSQVVQGVNYLIKVYVGHYLHLRVYWKIPEEEFILVDVEENHAEDDPLDP